jgi:hypothetical protein
VIDQDFLSWAEGHRTTSGLARFLGVSRPIVQNQLLELGLRQQQAAPFIRLHAPTGTYGAITIHIQIFHYQPTNLFFVGLPRTADTPQEIVQYIQVHSYTRRVSTMTDDELDVYILRHRTEFPRAGIAMIHGALHSDSQNVPHERIRQSLVRVDPIGRIFHRHVIERRVYSVPGPMALWHHDGQHGM